MQCSCSGCSDLAVIEVHLHFLISWKKCCCSGCSAAFCVPEGECSAHAGGAVIWLWLKCTCISSSAGRSVAAVVAVPRSVSLKGRSEERRVGKECRSRWSP